MSIRLRLTLLYTTILALTLIVFSTTLYTIQAQDTLNSLKRDLISSSEAVGRSILRMVMDPNPPGPRPGGPPPDAPFESLGGEPDFQNLREREIVRVLDAGGQLLTSPSGEEVEALPLSAEGLQALQNQQVWWQIAAPAEEPLLIYNRPIFREGQLIFILQVARPLTERNRSLATLSRTLIVASLLTTLVAFGIGWGFSGVTLRPIHRITQTAQAIGHESDFTRRVDYVGPDDEIGRLAKTFNSMLSQLQDAYQRVSHALKMQRDFVADVSHELRTPLTTVRGNLALLRRDPPLPREEQSDILTDLVEESDRLIRLVNDLLILARADAGRSLEQEPVAVQPMVEEVCRQARTVDRHREIAVAVPELIVRGDRDALKQVLLILLDNALKHTSGVIRVTAEAVEGRGVISVCDEGPGIPPEVLPYIFDRFYRGEGDSAGSKAPGFGLGLSIAKALTEGQGGTISIESRMGEGCAVRIQLSLLSA